MKLRELLKLPGYGRTVPLRCKAIYVGAPESPVKKEFKAREALVIRNFGDFSPTPVEPFIAQIRNAKGGSQ
jgi:hypothetical protein